MKRLFCIMLVLVLLLPLVGCGPEEPVVETPEDVTPGVKYDMLTDRLLGENYSRGCLYRAVSGGAIAMVDENDYNGIDSPAVGATEQLFVLFDEEALTLYPACTGAGCNHSQNSCFARELTNLFGHTYWNVSKDTVISVGRSTEKEATVVANRYGFDGTLQKSVEFDLTDLRRSDRKKAVKPIVTGMYLSDGNVIYVDVYDYSDIENGVPALTPWDIGSYYERWLLRYDVEKDEFEKPINYVVPDERTPVPDVISFSETELIIYNGADWDLAVDLESGEGKRIEKGIADPRVNAPMQPGYVEYLGEVYTIPVITSQYIKLSPVKGGEMLRISRTVSGDAFAIQDLFIETEKGFIFSYYPAGEDWFDRNYTSDSGEEMRKAEQFVYVTKEDFFDGKADSPKFFNPETKTFE
ncbi:MAG: hypothetical protein IJY86_06425 [Clostridia bacterium]|nr:hypothetical protein [Clostridia bacterium]